MLKWLENMRRDREQRREARRVEKEKQEAAQLEEEKRQEAAIHDLKMAVLQAMVEKDQVSFHQKLKLFEGMTVTFGYGPELWQGLAWGSPAGYDFYACSAAKGKVEKTLVSSIPSGMLFTLTLTTAMPDSWPDLITQFTGRRKFYNIESRSTTSRLGVRRGKSYFWPVDVEAAFNEYLSGFIIRTLGVPADVAVDVLKDRQKKERKSQQEPSSSG